MSYRTSSMEVHDAPPLRPPGPLPRAPGATAFSVISMAHVALGYVSKRCKGASGEGKLTDLAWMKTYIGTETAITGHLTPEEFGCYERLRRHYWQHGSLPEDNGRLIRITGVAPDQWIAMADAIGLLLAEALPKLEQERWQAAGSREKKIAAGKLGASKRWGADTKNSKSNGSANGKPMADAIAKPPVCQWPSASASDEVRFEEGLAPPPMRARETAPSEEPLEPFSTDSEARSYLRRKGVPDEQLETLTNKLQAWRLYESEIAKFERAA